MSPKSDVFLSAAEDKQVRLWDLRANGCQALLQAPGLPTTAFDEQVGARVSGRHLIKRLCLGT
jgi:COMPASS component SWD2